MWYWIKLRNDKSQRSVNEENDSCRDFSFRFFHFCSVKYIKILVELRFAVRDLGVLAACLD